MKCISLTFYQEDFGSQMVLFEFLTLLYSLSSHIPLIVHLSISHQNKGDLNHQQHPR